MKIGIISDTHLRFRDEQLERIVEDHFADAEIILHAGDLVCLDILDVFAGKEVYAVSGNMDSEEVVRSLPVKRIIKIRDHRIGLIHGWGDPLGIEDRIRAEFEDVACLVYGHTHRPVNQKKMGTLFFNPGSPTDRRFSPYNSVGILDVNETIHGKIIRLEERQ
jgi:putative phosphoesterase